jgi:Flp pilus assembly pilin Flp
MEQKIMRVTVPVCLIRLWNEESGQGLVEYVLILALVAFAAVSGMSNLASSINSAFAKVGTYLGKYIS